MQQIFNELSVSCCYNNEHDARDGMMHAINVSKELSNLGMHKDIRTIEDFTNCKLTSKYTINHWKYDKKVNKELRLYFLTHATKYGYIKSDFLIDEKSGELLEYTYNGAAALGLGFAHYSKAPAISLEKDTRFAMESVTISQYKIANSGEDQSDVQVDSYYNIDQVIRRSQSIRANICKSIQNGKDLIDKAKDIFPRLMFCKNAKRQIADLTGSEAYFSIIISHLENLDTTMKEWSTGSFTPAVDHSHESHSTLQNAELCNMRTFKCEDGIDRLFIEHTKIRGANQRIHYHSLPEEQRVHIGHIGDHLPTTNY